MKHRIIYHNRKINISGSVNAEIAREESNHTIYHTDREDINAIKVYNNNNKSEILLDNEDVIKADNDGVVDVTVDHIRKMESKYELYIIGHRYSATSAQIGIYGEINKCKKDKSTNILINKETIIEGDGSIDNTWEWEFKDVSDDIKISINTDKLADDLGGEKCVVVRSSNPIDSVLLFDRV